jgi:hypothetical protein
MLPVASLGIAGFSGKWRTAVESLPQDPLSARSRKKPLVIGAFFYVPIVRPMFVPMFRFLSRSAMRD